MWLLHDGHHQTSIVVIPRIEQCVEDKEENEDTIINDNDNE
jgi:hypothetical protein